MLKLHYLRSFSQKPEIGACKALISSVLRGCEKESLGLDGAEEVRRVLKKGAAEHIWTYLV